MDNISNYRQLRVLVTPQKDRSTVSIVARERRGGGGVDRLLLRPGSLWIASVDVSTVPECFDRAAEALAATADALRGTHRP